MELYPGVFWDGILGWNFGIVYTISRNKFLTKFEKIIYFFTKKNTNLSLSGQIWQRDHMRSSTVSYAPYLGSWHTLPIAHPGYTPVTGTSEAVI